ncbi:MAG: DipZ protein [Solirubrobacterales bacterium]
MSQREYPPQMKPPRQDIAAPPLPVGARWIGGEEAAMERLTDAGPVLVNFFDFAQLNSVRTLPYLGAWHRRYAGAGLTVLGVHTARFPFSEDPAVVETAVERLEIPYPVVVDEQRAAWAAYGCHGWPSLFLWSRGGALSWYHFGEGDYLATEEAIQEQLGDVLGSPLEPVEPMRPGDAPGAGVIPPTPELLPGGSEREPWRSSSEEPALEVSFEAAGAWASLDGVGELAVDLDGSVLQTVVVEAPGLYQLTPEGPHASHRLVLRPGPELAIYSLSFAVGVPG